MTDVSFLLRPANGGRTCVGATYQFQMCNTNECEDIYNDPREEQCRTWEPDFELHSNKHQWLPYEHPDRECTHPPRADWALRVAQVPYWSLTCGRAAEDSRQARLHHHIKHTSTSLSYLLFSL